MSRILLALALAVIANSQTADPAYPILQKAYEALRAKDYSSAISGFEQAIAIAPDRPALRKDLAYTLLKIGETEAARDQFAAAMSLDTGDTHVALEYAFLCYETKQPVIARRIFDRIRKTGDATAAQAFENIDGPLREGIERWTKALALAPGNFSAHEELAHLAERRDELPLAAEHYEKAWRLRPERRGLLLDLGRVWKDLNRNDDSNAALLAASRGDEPRVADEARALLPKHYPFVYEFERALALDPSNAGLRRELAYLHLQMNHRAEAEKEFQAVVEAAPSDLLSMAQLGFLHLSRGDTDSGMALLQKVLAGQDNELTDRVRAALHMPPEVRGRPGEARAAGSDEAKRLAEKSFEKGYFNDALKYLRVAHENDPVDFSVMLKLGWTYNLLKDDQEAVRWFNLARKSPDQKTASEASQAYHNLAPALQRFQTTVWVFPMFSTRWHDMFAYAQAKTELRLSRWFVRPYVSVRFVGDSSGSVLFAGIGPQYLSERSVIVGLGAATVPWRGMTGWFEAGESLRYSPSPAQPGRMLPDYRGGLSYTKGFGHLLARGGHGAFAESNDDGIYVSRFGKDTLLYSQNRAGFTMREAEALAGFHAQVYWNGNITVDALGQYWANYVETGPGVRFRMEGLRTPLLFSVNLLRGAYLINQGNPRGPNFNDLRVGVWYAVTK